MPFAVVGLGSNLGDRLAMLREASSRIRALVGHVRASAVFETDPVGGPPQGPFLNAAIAFEWASDPHRLLDEHLAVERALGRVRAEKWGPRTIDLDILWIEGLSLSTDRLTVPHPRLRERAFALLPLLDVAPHAVDLATGSRFERPRDECVRRTKYALLE